MNIELKDKLVALGADTLAQALITLSETLSQQAQHDAQIQSLIDELCESEAQQADDLIQPLLALHRDATWINAQQAPAFARQLEHLLTRIKQQISDPYLGVDLLCRFFQTDQAVLSQAQDPTQVLRQVYEYDARALLIQYAKQCDDQAWLADKLFELLQQDDWQVRMMVWHDLADFVSLEARHQLIDSLQNQIRHTAKPQQRQHWQRLLCTLARLNQDGALYEQTRLAASEFIDNAVCVDIARVYLESDDKANALLWLNRIPSTL